MDQPERAERASGERAAGGGTWILVLLCTAQFMVILDTTIVNVALPSIGNDLDFAGQAGLQYVISLYALAFGGTLILAGRIADLYGRRRVFVLGLVGFTIASIGCGLATTPVVLLTARIAQGLGSALISAAALSLLTTLFAEGAQRARALGAWGAVGGAAGASGLLIGGALTGTLGWQWIFFLNVPVGAVAVVAAGRLLPHTALGKAHGRLDLPGALTVTAGLGMLVFGLTSAESRGVGSGSTLAMVAAAVLLLLLFVLIEQRRTHPLVSFAVLRTPGVAAANLTALLLTTVIASNLFFTTLYVQEVLGFDPLRTGAAFLPNSVLVVVGSSVAARLMRRLDTGVVLACGLAILACANLLLSGVSSDGGQLSRVLPGFALTGFGLGMAFVGVTNAATRGVAEQDQGLISGVLNTAQQIGFAVGIAAVVSAATALGRASGGGAAQVSGYTSAYLLDTALAALAAVFALVLIRGRGGPRIRPTVDTIGSGRVEHG